MQARLALQKQEMQSNYDKLVGRDTTVKLRKVKSLSDEEMDGLSTYLNRRMHEVSRVRDWYKLYPDPNPNPNPNEVSRVRDWYKLYKIIDNDGSGRICFGELTLTLALALALALTSTLTLTPALSLTLT